MEKNLKDEYNEGKGKKRKGGRGVVGRWTKRREEDRYGGRKK